MAAPRTKPDDVAQEVWEGIAVAKRLRDELGLPGTDPVDCMLELAERRLGTEVVVAPLGGRVSGFYLPVRPVPLIVVEQDHPVQRQRFTIAHELGHHALGHAAAPRIHGEAAAAGDSTAASPETAPSSDAAPPTAHHFKPFRAPNADERAANAFAAELLIPGDGSAELLRGWFGQPPLDLAVRLSSHYGVSAFAAVVKLQTLAVIDRATTSDLRRALVAGAHLPRYAELQLALLDDELQRHADRGGPRCSSAARATLAQLRAEADAAI